MRLGYFTMPVHPMGRDWSQTLREDREAIILADKLGFHDAIADSRIAGDQFLGFLLGCGIQDNDAKGVFVGGLCAPGEHNDALFSQRLQVLEVL